MTKEEIVRGLDDLLIRSKLQGLGVEEEVSEAATLIETLDRENGELREDKELLDFLEKANGHIYLTHMSGANINDLFLTGQDEIRASSLRDAIRHAKALSRAKAEADKELLRDPGMIGEYGGGKAEVGG